MNYQVIVAREKFRFRARLLFYAGISGWVIWLLIALSGSESKSLSVLGGLAILTAIVGTYVGVPMVIRSRYAAIEPTPWRAPGVVALVIFVFILVFGLIPNGSISLIVGWVSLVLIPVFLYTLIWMIVLLIQGNRRRNSKFQNTEK